MFQLSADEVKTLYSRIIQQDVIAAAQAGRALQLDRMQAEEICYLLEKDWCWDKVGDCYYRLKRELNNA